MNKKNSLSLERNLANDTGKKFLRDLSKMLSLRTVVPVVALIVAVGCTRKSTGNEVSQVNNPPPVKVIFETDMGNDIDDALALDMLYKYADDNKVEILAITLNKNNKYAPLFVDILNNWYGYPDIPIGMVTDGADSEGDSKNYAQVTWEYQIDGRRAFEGTVPENADFLDAVELYRQILAQQPDQSVVIVSVGFSTNLARLLDTPSDDYSKLSGKELISEKVKLLSVMAGNFNENKMKEYNVVVDIKSAQKVFEDWPTKIAASPWELGNEINYPASSIQNDFKWAAHHPLVVAYESYLPMPYDRPTWDLTSVLYAVEGGAGHFSVSNNGKISVDDEGYTHFVEDPDGQHQYLKVSSDQATALKNKFVEIITAKPSNRE
jgi:inosine-uridine nucleoside N-ribohydrolase